MLQKYSVFFKSIISIIVLSLFFLIWQGFNPINMVNTLFLVALFFFCVYCFKWILDQGTFYTFEYSWQKTKRYVFFFLPKYWNSKQTKQDYGEETGEKIYHTYEEFYEYKQTKKWEDINQLLCSTLIILAITFVLSFIIM